MYIDKMGITERGDASLDFSWVDKLLPANIIISKCLTVKLIQNLCAHKESIIFHCTCTGFGGTTVEPNIPLAEETHRRLQDLIRRGFPKEQIVLRIDPIFPDNIGLSALKDLLELFKDVGVTRCRFSFLDLYPHTRARLLTAGYPLQWQTFTAPKAQIQKALDIMEDYKDIYEFEACAEDVPMKIGCISHKDLAILGHTTSVTRISSQRRDCSCLDIKQELLTNKKQCPYACLYCYWK